MLWMLLRSWLYPGLWCVDVEPCLHSWDKFYLVRVDGHFDLLLIFFENFLQLCSLGILIFSSLFFFVPLSEFGVMVMSSNELEKDFSLSIVWNSLRRIGVTPFLKVQWSCFILDFFIARLCTTDFLFCGYWFLGFLCYAKILVKSCKFWIPSISFKFSHLSRYRYVLVVFSVFLW